MASWQFENRPVTESYIRQHQYTINWDEVSCNQALSESFIREFQDRVHWIYISAKQILSESFILEFKDKVHWQCIVTSQEVTYKIALEYLSRDDLPRHLLLQNKNLDPVIREYIKLLSGE